MCVFISCISDTQILEPEETDPDSKIYFSLQLSVVSDSDTRSETIPDGHSQREPEKGINRENEISSAELYFFENNECVVHLTAFRTETESFQASMSQDELKILNGREFTLYVVANGAGNVTDPLTDLYVPSGILSWKIGETLLPMTNADIVKVAFNLSDEEIRNSSREHPFRLLDSDKPVKLERCVSRFDFKDLNRTTGNNENRRRDNLLPPFVYSLGETGLYVKIIAMQPVNVARKSYLFPLNSPEENEIELRDTYLSNIFKKENGIGGNFFYNTPLADDSEWYYVNPSTDNTGIFTDSSPIRDNEGYEAWCYVTENTLPAVCGTVQGVTTGVAFKVLLCNKEGNPLSKEELTSSEAPWNDKIKFTESEGTVFAGDDISSAIPLESYKTADGENAFAMVYYYWNQHDAGSGSSSATNPMEFAVVRNNIYKLCVVSFDSLPRPYDPEANDKPSGQPGFSVNIKVLSWTKRNISASW